MGKVEKKRGIENAKPTKLERGIFPNEEAIDKAEEFLKKKYQVLHGSESKESHGLPSLHSPLILHNPTEVLQLIKDPGKPFYIGGIYNQTVNAGDLILAVDGYRLILSAYNYQVIFSQNKNFYAQTGQGFISDMIYAPIAEAGQKSKIFVEKVSKLELKLVMGIIAGSGTLGFFIIIGSEIIEFIYEHKSDFGRWSLTVSKLILTRKVMKKSMPTLYNKVWRAVVIKVGRDFENKLGDSIKAESVFFAMGVVIGSVGKKLVNEIFAKLALLLIVLEQIAVRFLLDVLPTDLNKNFEEYQKHISSSILKLKESGVVVTDYETKQIYQEIKTHRKEIDLMYKILTDKLSNIELLAVLSLT